MSVRTSSAVTQNAVALLQHSFADKNGYHFPRYPVAILRAADGNPARLYTKDRVLLSATGESILDPAGNLSVYVLLGRKYIVKVFHPISKMLLFEEDNLETTANVQVVPRFNDVERNTLRSWINNPSLVLGGGTSGDPVGTAATLMNNHVLAYHSGGPPTGGGSSIDFVDGGSFSDAYVGNPYDFDGGGF